MRLFILRHGDAVPGAIDSQRELSDWGYEQVRRIAEQHIDDAAIIEQVVSSPFKRAAQTADIFTRITRINNIAIDWLDDLTPQGSLRALEGFLHQTQAENILLVSHLPLVGLLIDYLTGETGSQMGTANLASLSMDYPAQGLATLNWNHYVD